MVYILWSRDTKYVIQLWFYYIVFVMTLNFEHLTDNGAYIIMSTLQLNKPD